MQSKKPKHWPFDTRQPENPEEERFAEKTIASITRLLAKRKQEKRIAKTHCTFCGKDANNVRGPLMRCMRCKAAHYCDRNCQVSDYQARHKDECATFVHPPTTDGFLTKPIAGERYPPQPVFAHSHSPDGVGCWVTVEGCIDCNLRRLIDPLDLATPFDSRSKHFEEEAGRRTIRTHKALALSLLDLRVLVQNRRADKTPIFVYGARAQAEALPPMASHVLRGEAEGESINKFIQNGMRRVVMGVARDPWDKAPRVRICSINGAEVKKGTRMPLNIKDAKEATILLHPGEYAILHLQFRVGDGDTITKDWQALGVLQTVFIPWVLWDGISTPASPATPDDVHLVQASFDQRRVRAYFADFIEHGQDAFVRSHFGDVYADLLRIADEGAEREIEAIFADIAKGEDAGEIAQMLRDMGMDELADKLVRASRQ